MNIIVYRIVPIMMMCKHLTTISTEHICSTVKCVYARFGWDIEGGNPVANTLTTLEITPTSDVNNGVKKRFAHNVIQVMNVSITANKTTQNTTGGGIKHE